jgi:hypothetical protein
MTKGEIVKLQSRELWSIYPKDAEQARRFVARKTSFSMASEAARLILSSYPQSSKMANPDCYVAQVITLLAAYPPEVVAYLAAPVTGIVGKSKWLPSVAEIKEMADGLMYVARERVRREDLEISQVKETKRIMDCRAEGIDPFAETAS